MITALLQCVVVWLSSSVALLADTIHNLGDATTSIPLWIAFALARRKPSKRFTYGLGRVEDLAGVAVVLTILFSAIVAAYQAIDRLLHPQPISHLLAVVSASVIGFLGNELVALFRIRVGKEMGSAALVADGYHARVDGLTSLAVLFGAVGVWLGYPLADPIVGLIISATIFRIVWDAAKTVFLRLLDGVEPEYLAEIRATAQNVAGVEEVTEVRARWIGHKLHTEINIAVLPALTVAEGHAIALEVQHQLSHQLRFLSDAIIHVDPVAESGEKFHYPQREAPESTSVA
jgi:cation diffusion facilitator family transporter